MTDQTYRGRDRDLVRLAGVVTVVALVCVTILTALGQVSGDVAALGISTALTGVAGFALGRMSGATGERP